MADMAIDYFRDLLGTSHPREALPENVHLNLVSARQHHFLSKPFSRNEVLATVKSMAKHKSPGPDVFPAEFFISTWDLTREDFTNAVIYLFNSCHMPRIVNSTAIALIHKCLSPNEMKHFRPISCCNTIYKCISKMLSCRIKTVLPSLVSLNQNAFIKKRIIGDNILLEQALCRNYHTDRGPARCTMKLDLKKAFDSVSWDFIFNVMLKMKIPDKYIRWIHGCISTAWFSVKINGSLEGFFPGKSGLRQGDPLSPYLFIMEMEVLTAIIDKK